MARITLECAREVNRGDVLFLLMRGFLNATPELVFQQFGILVTQAETIGWTPVVFFGKARIWQGRLAQPSVLY